MPTFNDGDSLGAVRELLNDGLTKLDGIESGATADQTGAEIKALYEAEADTNAFTDSDKANLNSAVATVNAITDQGGDLYAAYETRAEAVTAIAGGLSIADGGVLSAAGLMYLADDSSSSIADMLGFVPFGEPVPGHFGAVGDGVTDDTTAVNRWKNFLTDIGYATANGVTHPDVRQVVDINIVNSTSNPTYTVEGVDDTRLTGRLDQTGQGGTLRNHGDTNGTVWQDLDVVSDGFAVLLKPGLSSGSTLWAENGIISRLNVKGEASTADVGISLDGDVRNYAVLGNLVRDIERSDGGGNPPHAFAVAGAAADPSTLNDCQNIMILGNVVDNINGNVFHTEDENNCVSFSWNVARNSLVGIEVSTGTALPTNQNYVGNMFSGMTEYFIDSVGAGSSNNMNYAFNIMDGAGTSLTQSFGVRINQANTKNINYFGNIHDDFTVSAFESTARGPFNVSHNVFSDITGDAMDLGQNNALFTVSHNMFDTITGDVMQAPGSSRTSPSDLRGVLVESNNSFESITGEWVDKANSQNLVGDQAAVSAKIVANVASNELIFVAKQDGWLTGVTRVLMTAGAGGGNSTVSVYKTNSGSSTLMFDNSIPQAGSQYDTFLWGSESVQLDENKFERGDIIRIECDGLSTGATEAHIQLDFFYGQTQ